MKVNPTTMLITDFGNINKNDLYIGIKSFIMKGYISDIVGTVLEDWSSQCKLDARQKLLTMSTVFPNMVLLSLTEYWRTK